MFFPHHPVQVCQARGKKGNGVPQYGTMGIVMTKKNLGASEGLRSPTVIGAALHATSADFTGPTDSLVSPYQESTRASSPMGQAEAISKVRYEPTAIAKKLYST